MDKLERIVLDYIETMERTDSQVEYNKYVPSIRVALRDYSKDGNNRRYFELFRAYRELDLAKRDNGYRRLNKTR
jgi:hypothetical protein